MTDRCPLPRLGIRNHLFTALSSKSNMSWKEIDTFCQAGDLPCSDDRLACSTKVNQQIVNSSVGYLSSWSRFSHGNNQSRRSHSTEHSIWLEIIVVQTELWRIIN